MSLFSDHKNEVTCIYNSTNDIHKQTLAYLSASKKKLMSLDITKSKITGSQWAEVAERLAVNVDQLIDFNSIQESKEGITQQDCIKILCHNPNALLGTIIFTKEKAKQITNPSKAMEFISPDSAGIEKKRLSEM